VSAIVASVVVESSVVVVRKRRRGAGGRRERVVIQGDRTVAGQSPTGHRHVVVHRDRGQRQDVATIVELLPNVAELPTCQNTLHS
jgi:hypothetical protein